MTRVKFCGFTREEDVVHACTLGVEYLGFNFCPGSPRCLSIPQAEKLRCAVFGQTQIVGVFINPEFDLISRVVEAAGITAIQLHGPEGPEFCAACRKAFPQLLLIKAIRMHTAADLAFPDHCHSDFVLLDAWSEETPGGTGRRIGDELLQELPVPADQFFLAGGLHASTVAYVVRRWRPFAVDCASGIETAPGIKDHVAMDSFFAEVQKCQ